MKVDVKICGLTTPAAVQTAVSLGVEYLGFIFHAQSSRNLSLENARILGSLVPSRKQKVAVTVDATDAMLDDIIANLNPQLLQLHGHETPERVQYIRTHFGLPVIKAIPVAHAEDVASALTHEYAADYLLFDTKSPDPTVAGGTGKTFDWSLLKGHDFLRPWFLSGGLSSQNVLKAITSTGARAVDVSSSLEKDRGIKDPERMRAFMHVMEPYRI